jgi:glycosyltransferase involved in cell wall biosynthesis
MMIRVLFVDSSAVLGGGETYLLSLLRNLPAEVEATVALPEAGPTQAALAVEGRSVLLHRVHPDLVHRAKSQGERGLLSLLPALLQAGVGLAREIRRGGFDLVHTNSNKADLYGGLAARLAGRPCLWHLHDIVSPDFFPRCFCQLFPRAARFLADRVLCNSQASAQAFIAAGGPAVRTLAVPNGIDTAQFAPRPPNPALRAALGLPDELPLVGLVGRIAPWKGQIVFVEAAARVAAPAHFVLLGDALVGEEDQRYKQEVLARIGQHGLTDRFHCLGFREDVPEVMALLDVVVHASILPEPFGLVVAEAMAMEKPVVATDRGGPREIVVDGEWKIENGKWRIENRKGKEEEPTGLLVPPQDPAALAEAVNWLLGHPEEARAMGKAGRQRVLQHFDQRQVAAQIVEIYRQVLAERGKGP